MGQSVRSNRNDTDERINSGGHNSVYVENIIILVAATIKPT